ncbi:MAG TPA: hypothetical protein VKQ29_07215 [Aliidongia sp.]|nr:hypothetical protein [Aliidongia sp.]
MKREGRQSPAFFIWLGPTRGGFFSIASKGIFELRPHQFRPKISSLSPFTTDHAIITESASMKDHFTLLTRSVAPFACRIAEILFRFGLICPFSL